MNTLKKKILWGFLITSTFINTIQAAEKEGVCIDSFESANNSQRDIDRVFEQVKSYKDEGRKVALILGAVPSEANDFQFNEENGFKNAGIIYFNERPVAWENYYGKECYYRDGVNIPIEWQDHLLIGDFNCISDLDRLFAAFEDKFDLIISDYGTDHFMQFTSEHLTRFLKLLNNNGRMLFEYCNNWVSLAFKENNQYISHNTKQPIQEFMPDLSESKLQLNRYFAGGTRSNLLPIYTQYANYIQKWNDRYMPNNSHFIQREGNIPYIKNRSGCKFYLELSKKHGL